MIAAVEADLWRIRPLRCGMDLARPGKVEDLRPKPVRFLDVTHVKDQMIGSLVLSSMRTLPWAEMGMSQLDGAAARLASRHQPEG